MRTVEFREVYLRLWEGLGSPATPLAASKSSLCPGDVGWSPETVEKGESGEEEESKEKGEGSDSEDSDDDTDSRSDDEESGGSETANNSASDSEGSGTGTCTWSDSDSGSSSYSSHSGRSSRSSQNTTHQTTFSIRETNFEQGGLKLKISALKVSKQDSECRKSSKEREKSERVEKVEKVADEGGRPQSLSPGEENKGEIKASDAEGNEKADILEKPVNSVAKATEEMITKKPSDVVLKTPVEGNKPTSTKKSTAADSAKVTGSKCDGKSPLGRKPEATRRKTRTSRPSKEKGK
uniref:Uncharacterized protein n=1 Tax=Timema monikensis TaxID=170555 RepID=A0A7R9HKH5_9NEOP|nr:unnamed protein product [Timema monikensis]